MDLSNFKKIKSDAKTTLLKHKDGHEIKIAHAALSPEFKKNIENMPIHLAYGTDDGPIQAPEAEANMSQAPWANNVPPVPEAEKEVVGESQLTDQQKAYNANIDRQYTNMNPVEFPPERIQGMKFGPHGEEPNEPNYAAMQGTLKDQKAQQESEKNKQDWEALENEKKNQLRSQFNMAPVPGPSGLGSERAQPISDGNPQVPQGNPQDQGQANPMAGMDTSGLQMGATQMGMNAADVAQRAESAYGSAQATAAQAQSKALAQIDTDFNTGVTKKQAEIESIINEVKNQKIDPNHYMESKSAPGKVASAIGLILGGIGGGLTHQENPAMKFLNAQIERDVQSQQNNMSNKLNLMGHYSQQLGDMRAGASFAKAAQYGIYASKVDEAAGKMADPMAKARAQQLKAQLIQQAVPYLHQAQAYDMLYGKSGQNMAPEQKLLMMKNAGMINEQQYAEGNKEAGSLQNSDVARKNIMGAFDKLNQQNTVGNRVMHAGFEPASAAAFENEIVPLIKDKEGRVNEFEFNTAKKFKPQPGDSPTKVMQKRADLDRWIQDKSAAPTLQGLGITPRKNVNVNFKPRGQ